MEHGHVDTITRDKIDGWAADPRAPDEVLDVSIFRDGVKVDQVACDRPRDDLASLGTYGAGAHGFACRLSPPLRLADRAQIDVRFTVSGRHLGHGEALFEPGKEAPFVRTPPQRPPETFRPSAPADTDSAVRLFALYEDRAGLFELLRRFDYAALLPPSISAAGPEAGTSRPPSDRRAAALRDDLNNELHSSAFQRSIVVRALNAFADKRRLLFVHIPKCAGSNLSLHLTRKWPSVAQTLMDEALTSKAELFAALGAFAREAAFSDAVFVRGHIALDWYVAARLIRPQDDVFTIVRDPVEMAVSQVNYILTKIQLNIDAGALEPDTAHWLALLGQPRLPPELTPDFIAAASAKLLRELRVVSPNPICAWLGGGGLDAVVRRLADHNVEIALTETHDRWLSERWGVAGRTRQNESSKYLRLDQLGARERRYLQEITADDRALYAKVAEASGAAGAASVRGPALIAPPRASGRRKRAPADSPRQPPSRPVQRRRADAERAF